MAKLSLYAFGAGLALLVAWQALTLVAAAFGRMMAVMP